MADISYANLEQRLITFERHWRTLSVAARPNPRVRPKHNCQFVVLDQLTQATNKPLPVVLLVGINYTQDPTRIPDQFPAPGSIPAVTARQDLRLKGRIKSAVDHACLKLAEWRDCALAPVGGTVSKLPEDFHIVLTNLSPWITVQWWQRDMCVEAPARGSELLAHPPFKPAHAGWPFDHLEALHRELGDSVLLWIGHGKETVVPHWHPIVQRLALKHWLLVGNLFARTFKPDLRPGTSTVKFG